MSVDAVPAPEVRASDDERDATVARLREAVGAGRIDLAEFDRRASRAYAAETRAELAGLTADLVRPGPYPPRTGASGPVIARFGAIEVTRTAVRTPAGAFPLTGSRWDVYDYWHSTRVVPSWAIVLAVVGFFVVPFVSLLFLLVREPRTTGIVQVAVGDGLRRHVAEIPVDGTDRARAIHREVDYVRLLATA